MSTATLQPRTIARIEAVTALRDAGVTQTTAARRLGISRANVHNFRRKHGIVWQEKYTRETA